MAKLHFKYGTMNSGKSIDLIRTIYNYEELGHSVLIIKPSIDTKGDNCIETRIGLKRKVDILLDEDDIIENKLSKNLSCIFVDEAQFLTPKQVDELFLITKKLDIPVICYGLRNNFLMKGFSGSIRLLEIAEELEELPTLCKCKKIARYVGRKIDGKFVNIGEEVVIDGSSKHVEYVPLCGECYLKYVSKTIK